MEESPSKIMYLIDYYYGTNGGTEGQLKHLINNIDRKKFSPELMLFRPTEYIYGKIDINCNIRVLKVYKLVSLKTISRLFWLAYYIRREKIAIVHIYFNDASLAAPLFSWLGGAKVIVSRRDMGLWYTKNNLKVLPIVNKFVDLIIANSKAVKNFTQLKEKQPTRKLAVIHNGYDPDLFKRPHNSVIRRELGIGNDEYIIGIVANLSPVKRHADLIKAFSAIYKEYSNLHLVILGMGKLEGELKKLAKSYLIDEKIHFIGSVKDVIPIVKEFSIGVLCSESEGFSNAILEYVACGIPTVCTNTGGNPEIIIDYENGILVNVGDIEGLTDALRKILFEPGLAKKLGERTLSVAREFSQKKMLMKHEAVYNKLLSKECS